MLKNSKFVLLLFSSYQWQCINRWRLRKFNQLNAGAKSSWIHCGPARWITVELKSHHHNSALICLMGRWAPSLLRHSPAPLLAQQKPKILQCKGEWTPYSLQKYQKVLIYPVRVRIFFQSLHELAESLPPRQPFGVGIKPPPPHTIPTIIISTGGRYVEKHFFTFTLLLSLFLPSYGGCKNYCKANRISLFPYHLIDQQDHP